MRAVLSALAAGVIWSLGLASPPVFAQPVPQFRHYDTGPLYRGPRAAPDLRSRETYAYRTRLREAAPNPPNFASDHRLVLWGCGTSCTAGAGIDQRSGRVTFFPFSICCSAMDRDQGFNSVEFRPTSALIIFTGLRNEEGVDGSHFYEFTGAGFTFLRTVPVVRPPDAPEQSAPVAQPPPQLAPPLANTAPARPDSNQAWIAAPLKQLGYCVRPKIQYGQHSSYDGGKSALNLSRECMDETIAFIEACKAGGMADPDANCPLLMAASIQLMLREFGK